MDTVKDGVSTRQHGTVSGKGHWGGRDALFIKNALFGELVDIRRCFFIKAVTTEVVSPAGVNADQNDMADWFILAAAAGQQQRANTNSQKHKTYNCVFNIFHFLPKLTFPI